MNSRTSGCRRFAAAGAWLVFAVLTVFSVLFSAGAFAQQNSAKGANSVKGNDADTAAIKSALDAYTDEWNRYDAHALTLLFTEDCDYTAVSGVNTHGREALEKQFVTNFGGQFKGSTRTDGLKRMRFLSPDIASLDDYWTLTAPASDRPHREGYYHWILIRQDGKWLVALHHAADFSTPQAPAAK